MDVANLELRDKGSEHWLLNRIMTIIPCGGKEQEEYRSTRLEGHERVQHLACIGEETDPLPHRHQKSNADEPLPHIGSKTARERGGRREEGRERD